MELVLQWIGLTVVVAIMVFLTGTAYRWLDAASVRRDERKARVRLAQWIEQRRTWEDA